MHLPIIGLLLSTQINRTNTEIRFVGIYIDPGFGVNICPICFSKGKYSCNDKIGQIYELCHFVATLPYRYTIRLRCVFHAKERH